MSPENLVWTIGAFGIGLFSGLSINMRRGRAEDGGRVWRVSVDPKWPRWFFFAVGVLAVLSVAGTAINNSDNQALVRAQQQQVARQTFCNRELIRVVNANAGGVSSDRAALDELVAAVGKQILTPDPDSRVRDEIFRNAFRKYAETRASNAAHRQPYPPPNCGE